MEGKAFCRGESMEDGKAEDEIKKGEDGLLKLIKCSSRNE